MKVFFSIKEGTTTSTTVPFVKPSGITTAQVFIRNPNTTDYVISALIGATVNDTNIVLTVSNTDAISANWPRDFRVDLTNGERTWSYIHGTAYFQTSPGGTGDGTIADGGVTSIKIAESAVTTSKIQNSSVTAAKLNADVAEYIQDVVGAMLVAGTNATVTYDDTAGTITISATGGSGGVDEETVRDIVGTTLVSGTGIAVSVNDGANTVTIDLNATKANIGLGNVDNTSDANKPVSTATQTALDAKREKLAATSQAYVRDASGVETGIAYDTIATNLTLVRRAAGGVVRGGTAVASTDLVPLDQMNTALATKANTTHTHSESDVTGLTEAVQDIVNNLVVAGANVTKTYDDVANTLTIAATGGGGGGTDAEVVRDTIAAALVSGTGISITVDDALDTVTIEASSALRALSAVPTSGLLTRTGTNTYAARTIVGSTNLIDVTSGNGVGGNPTITVGADVVQTTATQTLTNKTLSAAKITSGSTFRDFNSAILIAFPTAIASAVNHLRLSNSVTGVAPSVEAAGTDTNINLNLKSKGTGTVQVNDVDISLVGHTHLATAISDSTATGRAVLLAVDAAAARTAIGAGTSNLEIGPGESDAKAGNYSPSYTDLPAGTTGRLFKTSGTWPARPSARGDIYFDWYGQAPAPTIVGSGTAGMRDGDNWIELP